MGRPLRIPGLLLVVLLFVAACGFPRPPHIGDDARPDDDAAASDAAPIDAASIDAPPIDAPSGLTLRVAGTGDDANDGVAAPVKTLKRALGLAAANDQVTSIVLASGRYSTAGGETFPYTVPANLFIVGPAGGGAILAGSNTEPGLTVSAGVLQDLELEDFTVAVTATGAARLTNVRVRTGTLAIRAETSARLTVDNLDIAGTPAACAKGFLLTGAAQLVAVTLATRNLGMTLDVSEQSTADLSGANISGDRTCAGAVLRATTTQTFVMKDSLVDNGDIGAQVSGLSGQPAPRVTFTNTILRNMKSNAIGGGSGVTLTMTGGALSNNGRGGFEGGGGLYTFIDVVIQENVAFGIYHFGSVSVPPALQMLTLRGCTVSGPSSGVYLDDGTFADLGTASSPGNNRLISSQDVGLYLGSTTPRIDAVGNTWRPNVQGTNASGTYPPSTPPITTAVPVMAGANYAITQGGISLHL